MYLLPAEDPFSALHLPLYRKSPQSVLFPQYTPRAHTRSTMSDYHIPRKPSAPPDAGSKRAREAIDNNKTPPIGGEM